MLYLLNPNQFYKIIKWLSPFALTLSLTCFAAGLYYVFWDSPLDYQQGDSVRIMYIHVPASWLALAIYSCIGLTNILYITLKIPLAGILARSMASCGLVFTLISLVTGAIWGKPMWGAWWVWDARLTSMLIMFFIYMGYILLVDSHEDLFKGLRAGAILSIFGLINLPIVKFSVDWWNTLHQSSSFSVSSAPSIHPDMLKPLLIMALGYAFYGMWATIMKSTYIINNLKYQALQRRSINQNKSEQNLGMAA